MYHLNCKQSIMNGEKAFKKFFKKQGAFPKFKKKNKVHVWHVST